MASRLKPTHKPIVHFAIDASMEQLLTLLAQYEKRSVSAMIRILLDEAIEARRQDSERRQAAQ